MSGVIAGEGKTLRDFPRVTEAQANDLLLLESLTEGTRSIAFGEISRSVAEQMADTQEFVDLMGRINESVGIAEAASQTATEEVQNLVGYDTRLTAVETAASDAATAAANANENIVLMNPMIREMMCINAGIDGRVWDLDELMLLVKAGEYQKFAIGDSFVDGGVTWRIFAKRFYPKWAFDGAAGNEAPHHIVCMPDAALGTQKYNTTNDNTGGYAASLMPAKCTSVVEGFSNKLKGYMKEFQIYENNKGNWAAVKRFMRPPTIIEMTGNQGWADQYSGGACSQFPLAQAGRHRIKGYWYWCMDPDAHNTTHFCAVGTHGNSSAGNASGEGSLRGVIVLG